MSHLKFCETVVKWNSKVYNYLVSLYECQPLENRAEMPGAAHSIRE